MIKKKLRDALTDEIQEETARPLSDPNLIDFIINHQLDEEPKFSLKEIDINGVAAFFHIQMLFSASSKSNSDDNWWWGLLEKSCFEKKITLS